MAQFTLSFKMDSAAFEDAGPAEIARILTDVTRQVEGGDASGTIRDYNGNTVGRWSADD